MKRRRTPIDRIRKTLQLFRNGEAGPVRAIVAWPGFELVLAAGQWVVTGMALIIATYRIWYLSDFEQTFMREHFCGSCLC